MFHAKVYCCFGVLSHVNQRAFRGVRQVIARRIVQFPVRVGLGAAAAVGFGVVLTVRHCRESFARRFRCYVNFEIQVVLRVVLCFVCVDFRRQFLHGSLGASRFVNNFQDMRDTRVGGLLVRFRLGVFGRDAFSCENGHGHVGAQRDVGLFLGFSLRVNGYRLCYLVQLQLFRGPGDDVKFAFRDWEIGGCTF